MAITAAIKPATYALVSIDSDRANKRWVMDTLVRQVDAEAKGRGRVTYLEQ